MRSLVAVVVSLVAAPVWSQESVAADTAQVQARLPSVRGCWERVMREEPTPSKAMLQIDVDPDGAVTSVTAAPLPARLVTCIAGRVRTWRFPSGGTRQLSYPLLLIAAE